MLKEIKIFLANSGTLLTRCGVNRKQWWNQAIEAIIAEYERRCKPDDWLNAPIFGKLKQASFTAALKAAIADVTAYLVGRQAGK